MKDNLYRFSYNYEEVYDVYSVRRIDGNDKIDYVPVKLIEQMIDEQEKLTSKKIDVDLTRCIYFNKSYNLAIVDLNNKRYTQDEIESIAFGINKSIEYHKTMMLSL